MPIVSLSQDPLGQSPVGRVDAGKGVFGFPVKTRAPKHRCPVSTNGRCRSNPQLTAVQSGKGKDLCIQEESIQSGVLSRGEVLDSDAWLHQEEESVEA